MLDLRGAETLKGVKTHYGGTFWARKNIYLKVHFVLFWDRFSFISFNFLRNTKNGFLTQFLLPFK
jgi:hypothetical protein